MSEKQVSLEGTALVDTAVEQMLEKKAENIVVIDIRGSSSVADWFVICESDNPVQNRAIADAVVVGLKEHATAPWQKEGLEDGRWILIDYVDVVIHIMMSDTREYYAIEKLWKDCPRRNVEQEG
jgi:ribosome-associated protein